LFRSADLLGLAPVVAGAAVAGVVAQVDARAAARGEPPGAVGGAGSVVADSGAEAADRAHAAVGARGGEVHAVGEAGGGANRALDRDAVSLSAELPVVAALAAHAAVAGVALEVDA